MKNRPQSSLAMHAYMYVHIMVHDWWAGFKFPIDIMISIDHMMSAWTNELRERIETKSSDRNGPRDIDHQFVDVCNFKRGRIWIHAVIKIKGSIASTYVGALARQKM